MPEPHPGPRRRGRLWQPLIKAEGRAVGRCDASTGRRSQSMSGVGGSRSWQMEGRERGRGGGGQKGEREKSPAGKLLPPVPSQRKTGTNREGSLPSRCRPSSEGFIMGSPIFGHHRRRGRPPLRRKRKAVIVWPLEEDSDLIVP